MECHRYFARKVSLKTSSKSSSRSSGVSKIRSSTGLSSSTRRPNGRNESYNSDLKSSRRHSSAVSTPERYQSVRFLDVKKKESFPKNDDEMVTRTVYSGRNDAVDIIGALLIDNPLCKFPVQIAISEDVATSKRQAIVFKVSLVNGKTGHFLRTF